MSGSGAWDCMIVAWQACLSRIDMQHQVATLHGAITISKPQCCLLLPPLTVCAEGYAKDPDGFCTCELAERLHLARSRIAANAQSKHFLLQQEAHSLAVASHLSMAARAQALLAERPHPPITSRCCRPQCARRTTG